MPPLFSPDGKTLYVSLYNGSAVSVVDLATGKASHLPVGLQQTGPSLPSSHPSHMAVHPSGKAVFVAVENTDLISIIDDDPSSKTYRKVTGNFDVRTLEMRDRKLWGAGPNHLTFAPMASACRHRRISERCGRGSLDGRQRQHHEGGN